MGVIPVILQIVTFFIAGYIMGRSDRFSIFKSVSIVSAGALLTPVLLIIALSTFDFNGYMFILMEFIQLLFFGVGGIVIGRFKQKWDLFKDQSHE